jgi:hypothetical protein
VKQTLHTLKERKMKTKAGIKLLLPLGIALSFLPACRNTEQEEKDQLAHMRTMVDQKAVETNAKFQEEKQGMQDEMNSTLDEIDRRLELINEQKGLMVKAPVAAGEKPSAKKEQILSSIAIMHELINENDKKIKSLQYRLKKSSTSNKEMEERLAQYEQRNKDADTELASLKDQLSQERQKNEKLTKDLSDRNSDYANLQLQYNKVEDDAYSVYYIAGSNKQLKKMKITEGNIFDKDLSPSVNKGSFTKVDSRATSSIPVKAKKAHLVTEHDKNSYKWEDKGDGTKELTITDPIAFWKTSKFLVIETRS